jgi:hypothetical protein
MVHKERYRKPGAPIHQPQTRAADCNCPRATARCAALINTIKLLGPTRPQRSRAEASERQTLEQTSLH